MNGQAVHDLPQLVIPLALMSGCDFSGGGILNLINKSLMIVFLRNLTCLKDNPNLERFLNPRIGSKYTVM